MAFPNEADGDVITIPSSWTVYLDRDTKLLGGLIIRGKLIFQGDVNDLILSANWIYVEGPGGLLQVGSDPDPRLTPGAIHLLWDPNTYEDPPGSITDLDAIAALMDHGLVVVDGGKLHLFGKPRSHSWLELQSTAGKGATTCTVNPNGVQLDWLAGDRVVLASTDFDWSQAEEFELSAVNGNTLTLPSALQSEHFASLVYATGKSGNTSWEMAEFGEVGLLNRNVVVTTRLNTAGIWSYGNGSFGHVMLMRTAQGSAAPVGQFQWTELHHLGISNTVGRYPIHYHYPDEQNPTDSTNSFVKFSSLHDCFHKWISLHNQRNVVLEGNVGYKTFGHGYYMEEYGTRECAVQNNLGIGTEPNTAEPFPATFWFENPKLLVTGNHAAGSAGSGMWLEPALGESWKHTNPAISCFCDNVAHSNETWGIIQDAKPEAFYDLVNDPPAFSGLVAWKNRRHGIWIRSLGKIKVSGCKMADNRAGMYPASEGLQTAGPFQAGIPGTALIRVDDCLFLGETTNKGKYPAAGQGGAGTYHEEHAQRSLPQKVLNFDGHDAVWDTLAGVEIYDGLIELKGCRFGNFEDRTMRNPQSGATTVDRKAGGISQVDYDSNYGAPCLNNALNAQEFDTVSHRVYWRIPSAGVTANMARTTVLADLNGSLLNLASGSIRYLMPQTAFLIYPFTPNADNGANLYWLTDSADVNYGQLILKLGTDDEADDPGGQAAFPDGPQKIKLGWLSGTSVVSTNEFNRADPASDKAAFPTNLLLNKSGLSGASAQVCVLQYSHTTDPADFPDVIDFDFQYAEALNQYIIVGLPCDQSPNQGDIICNNADQFLNGGAGTLADLRTFVPGTQKHSWRYDGAAQMLWIWTSAVKDLYNSPAYPEGTRAHWEINLLP